MLYVNVTYNSGSGAVVPIDDCDIQMGQNVLNTESFIVDLHEQEYTVASSKVQLCIELDGELYAWKEWEI